MTLITPFDPWKGKLCSCPPKYSLSPYTGCSHGCLYCYASSYIPRFHIPRQKTDYLKRLEREIKTLGNSAYITMANSSDPYLPLERSLKLTRNTLLRLKPTTHRIMIVTKSALVTRDLDILRGLKTVVISISLSTLKSNLAEKLEGNVSSPEERLKAIAMLSSHLSVVVRFDPLIYPLTKEEITSVVKAVKKCGAKQIITSTYKVRPDNFRRMAQRFPEYKKLWEMLYFKKGEKINGSWYLPHSLRKKLIEEVKEATSSVRLAFSTCREGFTALHTATCDGSDFFRA